MKLRREKALWSLLLGTSAFLLDSFRHRLYDGVEGFTEQARDTYSEASRRMDRASDAIRGEDHRGISTAAALLIGVGVGVGVGMLVAPASGEATRANLSNRVQEFGGRVRNKFSSETSASTGTYGS
jgi:hypothetical protein